MITIKNIYDLAIKMGIESDLRGKDFVLKQLKKTKEKYQKLPKEKKEEFDKEKLTNPYSDSRVFASNSDKKVNKIMAGIDIDTAELLLAKYLNDSSGKKIDLVLGHHPLGSALNDIHGVMHLQADILAQYGVPINIAESVMRPRINEIARGVFQMANYDRTVQAAGLLGFHLMCLHTPVDNLVANFLDKMIKKEEPETVGEVLKLLNSIPEYKQAIPKKAGPQIVAGRKEARVGKITLDFTGGTNGAKEIFEHSSRAGIGTVVAMHMREEWRKEAEKHHINVIICGDTQSDSIGMNLFLDELEKKGVEIIPCSGLIRVKRFKKQ